jgi:hypothetical protein
VIESRNPFLLLKHLDMLTESQIKKLPKSIIAQLRILSSATEEGKFSGEQIAEMKIWITSLRNSVKDFDLGHEIDNLLKKISDSF